jgi:hypothetical protein
MGLWTSKAGSQTTVQVKQFLGPTADIGGGGLSSSKRALLMVLHDLLHSSEISGNWIDLFRVSHRSEKVMKLVSFHEKSRF